MGRMSMTMIGWIEFRLAIQALVVSRLVPNLMMRMMREVMRMSWM